MQDPVTSLNSPSEIKSVPQCSTPLKEHHPCLSLQAPATPTHTVDSPPGKAHNSSASLPPSPNLSRNCCDDVIDLTQSDDDSDITYCSDGEGEHITIDSDASLNPTSCDSPTSQANNQSVILPATPEHSTVRTTSIILSYRGVL